MVLSRGGPRCGRRLGAAGLRAGGGRRGDAQGGKREGDALPQGFCPLCSAAHSFVLTKQNGVSCLIAQVAEEVLVSRAVVVGAKK